MPRMLRLARSQKGDSAAFFAVACSVGFGPLKAAMVQATSLSPIQTDIPARMDALPWSRWHVFIVLALGITWVLDGLEVTLAGAVGSTLMDPQALGLTNFQVGLSATCYLAGAVLSELGFGYATDRFGRRKLFFSRWWSMSRPRRPPPWRGTPEAISSSAPSPAQASAASTQPSIRPSMN